MDGQTEHYPAPASFNQNSTQTKVNKDTQNSVNQPINVSIPSGFDFNNFEEEPIQQPPLPTWIEKPDQEKLLKEAEIDLSEELQAPPVCLEIISPGGERSTIGTLGNFSLLIGKAKSRKTFLIGVLLAAVVRKELPDFHLSGNLPAGKDQVLYFDTEQGAYHVQRAAKRVLRLCGLDYPSNFKTYSLRKHTPSERLKVIEYAIAHTPNVGFIVIDGIRDLIASINDEEQATMLASKLLKWTEEQHLHIVCVLHQNKGDNNARGHLGTELQNKAESVLSITKDAQNKELSIVEAEYCRDKDFEPFAFEINDSGLPSFADHWMPKAASPPKSNLLPAEVAPEMQKEILKKIFSEKEHLTHKALLDQIVSVYAGYGVKFGINKAGEFKQHYLDKEEILKHGADRSPKAYYSLSPTVLV